MGSSVIDDIITEREAGGLYKNLNEFITRISSKNVNKRCIENLIKGGALDSLGENRKQMMQNYAPILDKIANDKKHNIAGQISLFEIAPEKNKMEYEVRCEQVEEYEKEELLAYEKEVIGIYISGHPLENYMELISKNTTAMATDFIVDEETGKTKVRDQQIVKVGGMISARTVKITKNNQNMAFLTLEDMVGSVEIIVFPRDYEKYRDLLTIDQKLFIEGRAAVSEENGKIILERIKLMSDCVEHEEKKVYIKFPDIESYKAVEDSLYQVLEEAPGKDLVYVYCAAEKQYKALGNQFAIDLNQEFTKRLEDVYGKENVAVKVKKVEASF